MESDIRGWKLLSGSILLCTAGVIIVFGRGLGSRDTVFLILGVLGIAMIGSVFWSKAKV